MRLYETSFLIAPTLPEEETEQLIEKMAGIITEKKGKMINVDKWGKRRLAYPIKKFEDAVYVFFLYKGDVDIPKELERNFKQTETIIRYLTIKVEERENIRRMKKGASRTVEASREAPRVEEKVKEKPVVEEKPVEAFPEKKPEKDAVAEERKEEKKEEKRVEEKPLEPAPEEKPKKEAAAEEEKEEKKKVEEKEEKKKEVKDTAPKKEGERHKDEEGRIGRKGRKGEITWQENKEEIDRPTENISRPSAKSAVFVSETFGTLIIKKLTS